MTNILSQSEIDELLNALTSGADPEPEKEAKNDLSNVRVYDFKTANKFPKEQIRTLNIVFSTFGQLFSNKLTTLLRTNCEVELLSVEELSFNEFNNSLPSPVILSILEMPPMSGSILMEVSPEVAYMIISRLLGGSTPGAESAKQFTEIELALIERMIRHSLRIFDESWAKILELNAMFDRIETSPQFAQIAELNDPVALVTFNLTIGGEAAGLISICIPHGAIEPIAKQLNTRLWHSSKGEVIHAPGQKQNVTSKLSHTAVSMTAYFEDTPATVIDIMNLQIGDVIRLSQKTENPLMVKVQHIPKFYAKIGTSGSKYAVQIVDLIKGENNEDESFTT